MEKGYYRKYTSVEDAIYLVAIHNKNGKGLLPTPKAATAKQKVVKSQSTIKMEKGYYHSTYIRYHSNHRSRNPQ